MMLQAATVVLGAGVHGSSAALHLARAGEDTILVEQFPLPHSRGSSHGQTRIIRTANHGIPALTPIMVDSFAMWKKLEEEGGVSLLRPHPMLGVSDDRRDIDKLARTIKEGGHDPIYSKIEDINRKYGMNFPSNSHAVIDPSAGVLMSDKCLQTLQRLFKEAGGRVVDEWPVDEVDVKSNGQVVLKGPKGSVMAANLVMCPGPWAGRLLAKMGVHLPLDIRRISVLYWRVKDEAKPTITLIDMRNKIAGHTFGLPVLEYPGIHKLVLHTGPILNTPEERDMKVVSEDRQLMMQYVKEYFPNLEPVPVVEESCLYTVTPDHEFIVDRHPSHPNIVYACGFSGSGFKIAPAIGEDLCRLALGRPTVRDLSAFSADRFKQRSKI